MWCQTNRCYVRVRSRRKAVKTRNVVCVWLLLSGFRDCRFNFLAHKYLSHVSYDFLFVNFKLLLCWDTPVYPASDGAT